MLLPEGISISSSIRRSVNLWPSLTGALDSSLDDAEFLAVRQVVARHGAAAIVIGNGKTSDSGYDAVLELFADGTWSWRERNVSSGIASAGGEGTP